ncbi:MAG: rRNA maturation RNase YbeY [Bacteroidales bacterium]|nr:rRNA maturation RNase YbeY [Bacteroidales bacterium]
MAIKFHALDIPEPRFERKILKSGISWLIHEHKKDLGDIEVVFCSDNELLIMNKNFLDHDFFTDVITFDYSEGNYISGDIYLSIDRLKENAQQFRISLQDEIRRVVGHGVLHLIGFKDKTVPEKKIMTEEENKFLEFFS